MQLSDYGLPLTSSLDTHSHIFGRCVREPRDQKASAITGKGRHKTQMFFVVVMRLRLIPPPLCSASLRSTLFTCRWWWWSNVIVCYSIPLFMFTIFIWHFCDFPRRRRLYLLLFFSYIGCVVVQLFKHVFFCFVAICGPSEKGKKPTAMHGKWMNRVQHPLAGQRVQRKRTSARAGCMWLKLMKLQCKKP